MSKRPNIPDGENYLIRDKLEADCVHLIADLLHRDYQTRIEPGNNGIISAHSQVYEPCIESDSDTSPPAVRVRQIMTRCAEQPLPLGQHSTSQAVAAVETYSDFQVYALDFGDENELYKPSKDEGFDIHDNYIWTPSVTAIVEKRHLIEMDDEDLDGFENPEEIAFHVHYADNGEEPDDIELLKLIHLLQSVLYTAREAVLY